MAHHHKSVEQFERYRRNHEQIHGDDAICVVPKKCLPSLGRGSSRPVHVPGDGSLTDVDAEFEQFAVDSGRAPQWVGNAHIPDQGPDFQGGFRSPCHRPGLPAPERPKSPPMPADHRLRLDNRQGIEGAGRQAIQPHKEQPISAAEDQPFRSFPTQHVELVAQGDDFRLQISP